MDILLVILGIGIGILLCLFTVLFELVSGWKMFVDRGDRRNVSNALERKFKPRMGAVLKTYDDQAWLNEIPSAESYDRGGNTEAP